MRPVKIVFPLLLLLSITSVLAQSSSCPIIVAQALAVTEFACDDLARNVACYGSTLVEAVSEDDATLASFQEPGDITSLIEVASMALSPMSVPDETWGIAVMSVQANLPDTTPGQNVMFLMFGDVSIENNGAAMESFYFRTGIGDAPCEEAPDSGILIRTPEGVGEITLTANNVEITLGSTAYLSAEANGVMTVALLEGQAMVSAEGKTQVLNSGFFTTIAMDESLNAAAQPNTPTEIPASFANELPIASIPSTMTTASDAPPSSDDSGSAVGLFSEDAISSAPDSSNCSTGEIAHLIQRGENLFRISLRYGVTQNSLALRNGITNPALINVGTTICIPEGGIDSGVSSIGQPTDNIILSTEEPTNIVEEPNDTLEEIDANWCNDGEPWEGQCNVEGNPELTHYLWQCGWYFARGLTSDDCRSTSSGEPDDTIPVTEEPYYNMSGGSGFST